MGIIHVLDKHTAELIAAGEVIERPSSVIKELVENAIDAHAAAITVEIKNGGITYMRVTDDGIGMAKEDVAKAFLRHATSKIELKDDLNRISTLGFRGEALASICAVAKVQLLTRRECDDIGTQYCIEGGDEILLNEAGCPVGTTFVVRDLFYNVPARMKFLKKDVTEANHIAAIMDRIALSHPEIQFTFIRDGKQTLKTPGTNNLRQTVLQVFGKEFANTLIAVDDKYNNIHVTGFVSKPENSRPNRTMQLFFINGRYVKSITAMTALENAYKGSIMVGKFPACVLMIQMRCDTLDVNVHPAKLEVRFTNERPVFESVYHSVKTALATSNNRNIQPSVSPDVSKKTTQPTTPSVAFTNPKQTSAQLVFSSPVSPVVERPTVDLPLAASETQENEEPEIWTPQPIDYVPPTTFKPKTEPPTINTVPKSNTEPTTVTEKQHPKEKTIVSKTFPKTAEPLQSVPQIIEEEKAAPPFRLIGEAFSLYIILEYDNDRIMFIDKHAAHERLLYERLKQQNPESHAQLLLEPVIITLDKVEYDAVIQNRDLLSKVGFDTDNFGSGSIIVRSVPQLLDRLDISETFMEIAGYLVEHRKDLMTEKMEWLFQNTACRAAVKSGNKLHDEELIYLATELERNPSIQYCPHGRPIYFLMTKKELEHKFMRIP
ncbi:MAG: DNA mismatch repair endonuclease MutL [Acutalibacteraceae bacterium]